ncbi:hypothetical protein [Streptacidiphilus sp. MAP5-3]|uniref:hypothetical protein n=1 Tax=unclassified Streptacidiphilus TaxID=2643834 RepID=UPI0035116FBE
MPSVVGLLEERERAALARAEELRIELERLQAAVAEAEEAARRAAVVCEEVVAALAAAPAVSDVEAVEVVGSAAPRVQVPRWQPGLDRSVLSGDCAAIVALVEGDAAGSGEGVRARRMRDHLGWQASDAREQAARFRAKRLVECGWLREERPGLFRPRRGWAG